MSSDRAARIDAFLQAGLDGYIAETAELCAQPSVSATGEGTLECAALVAQILERHGFRVERVATPGNPIVVGRAGGRSERTMLFYNHYDVQPPDPLDLWTSPPFEPTLRDGALYARGAKDDKGEFIARLAAVEAARAAGDGGLPCGVLFVVEGEEEIGSPHIAEFVRAHRDALRCHGAVWEEGGLAASGRPETTLGRRGILAVELEVQTMARDAHSGAAHILPNAAWRLHRALATLVGPDHRVLIRGFYDDVEPPSTRDLEMLAALPDEEPWLRQTYGVGAFVRGASGRALSQAIFEPTCNIAGIAAGYQGPGMKTVIPATATCKIDFRLVPWQDPEDIFAKLRSHLDREGFPDVAVRRLGAMWPARVPVDDPLVGLTVRAAQEVYGVPAQVRPIGGGSSPIYAFSRPLGIPVVTAGVGYAGNRTHAPDEHVRLVDFLNAARHIARILDGFADL
ncbi:MAG: M20/M25/M40 family metallo-hydrolase [Armatimonadota bacterium]|nr:M20/M25/M40 family metallo-hydrolase [Armatimonadota bacterium]